MGTNPGRKKRTTCRSRVVIDLSSSPQLDLQSAHTPANLAQELAAKEIRLHAVEARSSVRDRLRHEGLEEKLDGINRFTSVADAVDAFQHQASFAKTTHAR